MSVIVYLLFYLCVLIFLSVVVYRVVAYFRLPIHLRWELYPIPHEGKEKAAYGGGYLEDTDWWKKPRQTSKLHELIYMIKEIAFLKATWENNRGLWYVSYPFHLGLYMVAAFVLLLLLASGLQALVQPAATESLLQQWLLGIASVLGPLGFILCLAGAVGLFLKRINDPALRNYSSLSHYFNLAVFALVSVLGLLTWLVVDPGLQMTSTVMANLLSGNFQAVPSALLGSTLALGCLLLAYIPLTHMSHFFMKYFLYHDIRWGDESRFERKDVDKKLQVVLNYPVKWSAPHISGDGSRTWADIATQNPTEESDKPQ